MLVKQYDGLNEIVLDHHPFDVVGWDGYFYPWAFNINDFEPIVGRVHQPPPVHQTFQGDGFVVCSFCPRPYDFHPEAVPAPYNHSNVDSDEVLYYASSEFMSRKGIEFGSITHHPDGIPHGPHPGRAEASIGAKYTDELAVMMDSFRPLKVAKQALDIEDPELPQVVARRAARAVQSAHELTGPHARPRSALRVAAIGVLSLLFVVAGISHFRSPATYIRIVPPVFPDPALLVAISGVAELAGGLGILLPRVRRAAAWGLIALLVAVFPANIYMLTHHIPLGAHLVSPVLLWLRLPLQGVLIALVWWTCLRHPNPSLRNA